MTASLETTPGVLNPRHALIAIGLIVLAMLALSVKNFTVLEDINTEIQLLYRHELLPISHIKEANENLFDVERHLKRMIIARTTDGRSAARNAVAEGEQALQQQVELAARGVTQPDNIERISSIQKLYNDYKDNVDRAMRMIEQEQDERGNPANYILSDDFQNVVRATDKLLDQIAASKQESALHRLERTKALHKQSQIISLLIMLAILVSGTVSIYRFRSSLARPLESLRRAADDLSSGTLDVAIPYVEQQTSIGEMARAINRIQETFKVMERRLNTQPNKESASPSVIERANESAEKSVSKLALKRSANWGGQTSALCRSTHDYLSSLGESLYLQGELSEAEMPLRSALVLLPDSPSALTNLGCTLIGRGQFASAETCLRRALRTNPYAEQALYFLSLALAHTGRVGAAEVYQRRLLSINPWHEGALLLMQHFLSQKGRFEQAEITLKRATAINPMSSAALSGLANLRKMTIADAEWMNTAEQLAKVAMPGEEVQLRYAIGKYCDDIKDYDRAFANYDRANQLTKAMANNLYSPEAWAHGVDRLIQGNAKARMSQVLGGASDSRRPVFIVGMPRSGTSLIEQIMASHPSVFGAGELVFWRSVASVNSSNLFESSLSETTVHDLAESYLAHLGSLNADAARVIDKLPDNFFCVGLIHTVFPNAKIIHTRRNPVDTCLSIYFQNFSAAYNYSMDLADLAHYYRQYHRLMAHWRSVLPEGTLFELRYEDLVADQEGLSHKMIEFIGLDWDDRCLNYQDTERRVATASKWQVRQRIYKTSIERWRHYEMFIGPLTELQNLCW